MSQFKLELFESGEIVIEIEGNRLSVNDVVEVSVVPATLQDRVTQCHWVKVVSKSAPNSVFSTVTTNPMISVQEFICQVTGIHAPPTPVPVAIDPEARAAFDATLEAAAAGVIETVNAAPVAEAATPATEAAAPTAVDANNGTL